jgi:hypothetical protein
MAVALRHKWEAVTQLGAVGRVRPRAFVAVRQPVARLGQGGREHPGTLHIHAGEGKARTRRGHAAAMAGALCA